MTNKRTKFIKEIQKCLMLSFYCFMVLTTIMILIITTLQLFPMVNDMARLVLASYALILGILFVISPMIIYLFMEKQLK